MDGIRAQEGESFLDGETGGQDQKGAPQGKGGANTEPSKADDGQVNTEPKPAELPSWTTSASKELRADPRFAAFAGKYKNSLDEALRSGMDIEEKLAGMVKIPGENATDEEKAAYRKAIGLPETPDGYKLEAPADSDMSDEQMKEFKVLAHSMNLGQKEAQAFLKYAADQSKAMMEGFHQRRAQEKTDVEAALRKDWGDKYDANREVMTRGYRAFMTPELKKDIDASGLGNKASVIKLFLKLGELTLEDNAHTAAKGGKGGAKTVEEIAGEMYPSMDKK